MQFKPIGIVKNGMRQSGQAVVWEETESEVVLDREYIDALDGLEEIDAAGQLPIIIMGGIRNGVDAVKAIALGASAVGLGTSMLIAGGCISCMQCSVGDCTVGIATQDPEQVKRYAAEQRAQAMHRYLESFRWQMAAIIHTLGHSDFRQLSRQDLVALTPEAAALTRLPYEPGYRDQPGSPGGGEDGLAS